MDYRQMVEAARRNVKELTPGEAKASIDRGEVGLVLDVREPDEWARGHLPGALHVPMRMLGGAAEPSGPGTSADLVKHREGLIVAYCAHGNRSVLAADGLKKMGYANVVSIRGGIVDWAKLGFPVE